MAVDDEEEEEDEEDDAAPGAGAVGNPGRATDAVVAGLRTTQHADAESAIDAGNVVPGSSRYGQQSSTRMSRTPPWLSQMARKSA